MHTHPFINIPPGKLESLNALQAEFRQDARTEKADLMCGVYQTEEGLPYVLPSVKLACIDFHSYEIYIADHIQARKILFDDENWEHEYPSSHLGEAPFRDLSARLLFGDDSDIIKEGRLASMQSLGASGACHVGAAFLLKHYEPFKSDPHASIYLPAETWTNHPNVFHGQGFTTVNLPYYNPSTHAFDFVAFNQALQAIPQQSVVVLQICGNNPTGCDPSPTEWALLIQTFLAKQHFAFLDVSYPGFVSGDVAKDCAPIRLFADAQVPLLLAVTYGKAFGLYGERVGHLCIPLPTSTVAGRVEQQMKLLAREETGAQPRFGARIVSVILGTPWLRAVWEGDVRGMAGDLVKRRERLKGEILRTKVPGDWGFVTDRAGMFLYTSFDAEQIDHMRVKYGVYLQDTGRLSVAGLNAQNTSHVAESMASATLLKL